MAQIGAKRLVAAFAAVILLAACSGQDTEGQAAIDKLTAKWRTLKDGSRFARATVGDHMENAERCWPVDGKGFDCLVVSVNSGIGGELIQVSKAREQNLPQFVMFSGDGGYQCSHVIEFREEVVNGNATLVSQAVHGFSDAWSGRYVNNYMAENSVEGSRHFDCLHVLDAINSGSIETLATTSITQGMLK